ncbi:unnamed protein product [Cylicocyclus nassatus]|uniref:NAD(+) kinase n=1 Tax=Cylicocyclus nassatus TaxID=53992 RepID=A0AA36H872_CYLNA|nr:unnamed protein product [Cylicocyclus nassatus]
MRIRLNSNALVQFPRVIAGTSTSTKLPEGTRLPEGVDCWWGDAEFAKRMRLLPHSIAAALYRDPATIAAVECRKSSVSSRHREMPTFRPKKVLILSKTTRFEFEKRLHNIGDDRELENLLKRRGSDYHLLYSKHQSHYDYLKTIRSELEAAGVEARVVQRVDYTDDAVSWADAVVTAGGDGTFLLAASRIRRKDIPVIGINTDPQGSEGYMCLMRKLSQDHFKKALQRLFSGDFSWLFRQRIRITLSGEPQQGIGNSVELNDGQLNQAPSTTRWMDAHNIPSPPAPFPSPSPQEDSHDNSLDEELNEDKKSKSGSRESVKKVTVQLPVLALNEVFIGESLSSRVSYYEIKIDKSAMVRQKSSGIAICTGTGSTSWYFNINKLTDQCVSELLRIAAERCKVNLPFNNEQVVSDICTKFNQQLIFSPDSQRMAFSVRDPIFNATFPPVSPRGFAEKIFVKSRGYDAHLVVDGGVSYQFNDGAEASLEVHEEDALRTVIFSVVSYALEGKDLSEVVVGYLGIPYAKAPIKDLRFKESEIASFDETGTYTEWPKGCSGYLDEGGNEDCLYLSLLVHRKKSSEKRSTLLIITNEELSEKKLIGLVSSPLNIGVAAIRSGLLGSFANSSYGISDVINAVKFLKNNADLFNVGEITVWAESFEAETLASALSQAGIEQFFQIPYEDFYLGVDRAILINGNAKTRTIGRDRFSSRLTYRIVADLECDLPSSAQSLDCLRSKSLSELQKTVKKVSSSFYPFGNPFRSPPLEQPYIPTILGVYKQLPRDYPTDANFDENYSYVDFKKALAGLLPDSIYRNAPLLRRMILHHYIYTQGDKKNTYLLFEQIRKAIYDRDFIAPTQKLVNELRRNENPVYLLEYGIDNPPKSCLQDGGWEDIKPFCDKIFQYFTRFAIKGQPTKNSCEPTNPTWPAMGTSKRDYHVILKADGTVEWDSNFHLASVELWNNLLPALDQLELSGRRDTAFAEEVQLSPTELEDDVQEWHRRSAEVGGFDYTEEQALNDLPYHGDL